MPMAASSVDTFWTAWGRTAVAQDREVQKVVDRYSLV